MNRDSIIKGLAVLAAIVLVLFVGYGIVRTILNMSPKNIGQAETNEPATLDANVALKASIDTLEASWEKVQNYSFQVTQDPLHLGRVIKDFSYAQSGSREVEEDTDIRLTATVIDANPKAIIKFRNKSYVVQVGESIANIYRVVSITNKQVVLQSGGGTVVLMTKPSQGVEETGQNSDFSINDAESGNY